METSRFKVGTIVEAETCSQSSFPNQKFAWRFHTPTPILWALNDPIDVSLLCTSLL